MYATVSANLDFKKFTAILYLWKYTLTRDKRFTNEILILSLISVQFYTFT